MASNQEYASYLLRLKYIRSSHRAAWAVSLQSTATGEQRSFADLEALIDYLQAEFDDGTDSPNNEGVPQ